MNKIINTNQPHSALPQRQQGVATLLISLVILTTITFVLIYSARAVLMEQQLTTNDKRGRQSFEAAEFGQDAAVAYITSPGGRDKDNTAISIRFLIHLHPLMELVMSRPIPCPTAAA